MVGSHEICVTCSSPIARRTGNTYHTHGLGPTSGKWTLDTPTTIPKKILSPPSRTGEAGWGARPQPSRDRPECRRSADATLAAAEPGVAAAALPFCYVKCCQRRWA